MIIGLDVDGTLCWSKQDIESDMLHELARVLRNGYYVALFSGGTFDTVQRQVLEHIHPGLHPQIHVFTVSGGAYTQYRQSWQGVYWHEMTVHQRTMVYSAMKEIASSMQLDDLPCWGERIEYRKSQITYSLLGQQAPLKEKQSIDPAGTIKKEFADRLREKLPDDFDITFSKTTSIDANMAGVNKGSAVNFISNYLNSKMVYFGDRFVPGGNDESVLSTSAIVYAVNSPDDTLELIKRL